MLDAAIKSLTQMVSPPFRSVLLKSIGLALVLIVVVGIALQRVLSWLVEHGGVWAETAAGSSAHWPVTVLVWVLSIAAGLGILIGAVFLMPAVTALVASFFSDDIAEQVEREHYPNDAPGRALAVPRAVYEGSRTALVSVGIYLIALPFIFAAGLGVFILFFAAAYLLSREYFELAAMRFRPVPEARAFRKANQTAVFTAGLLIALFVSIPIVNLATPLFGTALMVHLHKRLSARAMARG